MILASSLREDFGLLGHPLNIIIMHLVIQDLLIVGVCDKVLKVVCTLEGRVGFFQLVLCQVSDDIGGDHGRADRT
jgi:hypothetical protein